LYQIELLAGHVCIHQGKEDSLKRGILKLLFVPSSGAGAQNWLLQTQQFPDSEAISLPGHPDGEPLNSISEYVEWLHNYNRGKGYRNVVLTGHSFGSGIALLYALNYGRELQGLILIGAGAKLHVHPDYFAAVKGMIGDEIAWRKYIESTPLPDPRLKIARDVKIRIGPAVLLNDLLCCDKFNVMEQVQNIRVPTLIIVGTEDVMTPVKFAQYLANKIPDAKLVVINGATHAVVMEKPDEVNRVIGEWVTGIKKN
jgi:pimeloyl-ACP methyl ester carboxylesterase